MCGRHIILVVAIVSNGAALLVPATRERTALMSMKLYNTPYTDAGLMVNFPRNIAIGSRVYVNIEFRGSQANDSDLHPLPLNCYHSTSSEPRDQPPDMMWLLRAGCPYRGSMKIVNRSTNQRARLLFTQADVESTRPYIFLHCKVAVCSDRGDRRDEGIADCPPVGDCASTVLSVQAAHRYPRPDQRPLHTWLSSGPMRPIVEQYDRYANNFASNDVTVDVGADYPHDEPYDHRAFDSNPSSSHVADAANGPLILVQGVSTGVVVFVAIVSFVIGMALVAALWCIHDMYKPHKHDIYAHHRDYMAQSRHPVTNGQTGQNYGVFYPPSQASLPLIEGKTLTTADQSASGN